MRENRESHEWRFVGKLGSASQYFLDTTFHYDEAKEAVTL